MYDVPAIFSVGHHRRKVQRNFFGLSLSNCLIRMKRFFLSAILTPITFALGVLVAVSWWHLFPRRVSLCMLARNPAAYDGKLIRVEALGSVTSSPMFGENDIIIFEPGCAEPDAWASVRLDPDFKHNREVEEFITSQTPEIRDAKLVIEGLFDQWASLGCFSPRFGIRKAAVMLVSPVTSKPLPKMPTRDSR